MRYGSLVGSFAVAALIAAHLLAAPSGAQEGPRTGYCGEDDQGMGLHVFTVGPGSDIGGYSHGPEPGKCSDLHPSIHQQ